MSSTHGPQIVRSTRPLWPGTPALARPDRHQRQRRAAKPIRGDAQREARCSANREQRSCQFPSDPRPATASRRSSERRWRCKRFTAIPYTTARRPAASGHSSRVPGTRPRTSPTRDRPRRRPRRAHGRSGGCLGSAGRRRPQTGCRRVASVRHLGVCHPLESEPHRHRVLLARSSRKSSATFTPPAPASDVTPIERCPADIPEQQSEAV